jgi:hypothetical protein
VAAVGILLALFLARRVYLASAHDDAVGAGAQADAGSGAVPGPGPTDPANPRGARAGDAPAGNPHADPGSALPAPADPALAAAASGHDASVTGPPVQRPDRPAGPNTTTGTPPTNPGTVAAADAGAAETARRGVVRVAGAGALRAEILVDGTSMGYAPREIELSIGPHSIVLRPADGHTIGPMAVTVTALHTHATPYLLKVP